jgi:hypothetical protein
MYQVLKAVRFMAFFHSGLSNISVTQLFNFFQSNNGLFLFCENSFSSNISFSIMILFGFALFGISILLK